MNEHELTQDELARLRAEGRPVVVIDVRTAEEFAAGHVDDARHVPGDEVAASADALRDGALVVTVCTKGGDRSASAAEALRALGVDARFLEGGTRAWLARRA